ncbi:MAG: BlaI/MecI/CopY family transcriptional regulator [Rikenellaceae bacterium]|nr:BlaI/MecI/CopY family transcriptional regulator [Rikenellaceae bacterium]MBR4055998.1 BlaI/MecI/CopY family transcriptional regulator [Rikenellaceae bacterium]
MAKIVKDRQPELTRAELEIMQVIWDKKKVLVHDILSEMTEPKPAYNTVSTVVRILEKKGYVGHKAYGKTHEYYPLIEREEYTNGYMNGVLNNFFGGSVSRMISFFTRNEKISLAEADEILKMLKENK